MTKEEARTLVWDFEEACLDYAKWRNPGNEALRMRLADQIIMAIAARGAPPSGE